ncbi:MAG: sulfatase-like hydrolase/transferase [Thermoanaerobaculia bacterium]
MRSARGVVLFAGFALVVGCARRASDPSRSFPRAPVIIISVDTLRSDHLPSYGYAGVETPAISAFRKDSILFERAYTQVPLTLPAHLSILTGVPPSVHGVHDNLGYRLSAGVPTLAELLKKEGYRTGGAVSAIVLGAGGGSGIGRGFDFYDDAIEPTQRHESLGQVQRSGSDTVRSLASWMARPGEGPLFAFLHLYEPHAPYEPPEPFKSRYAGKPYDGEIATADALVGVFLEGLERRGLYDAALIVLLSDHGESLGEHGEDEHGVFLYRASLQVPLLLKLPGTHGNFSDAGRTVATPVALTDVFTTVGTAVGLAAFPAHEGAVSLVALARGEAPPERRIAAETFFPRLHFGWSELTSVLDDRWHTIEAPRPEIYDLAADPGELLDRAAEKPGPFRSMRLEAQQLHRGFAEPAQIDREESKKLASLGYLTTGASAGRGPLPDPKDTIGTIRLLNDAMARVQAGRSADAVVLFRRLLAENPGMADVWELLSEALVDLGQPDEALASRRKLVELAPASATYPLLSVANLCLEIGRLDEGIEHAHLAKERGDAAADEILARGFLAKGNLPAAEAAAQAAVALGKTHRRGLLILARIAVRRGDSASALALVDRAASSAAGESGAAAMPIGLHTLRGDILARMNRPEDAESEFLKEIALYPRSVDPRVELAVVYASQRRTADMHRVVEQMLREVPRVESYLKAVRTLSVLGDRDGAEKVRRKGRALYPDAAGLGQAPGAPAPG